MKAAKNSDLKFDRIQIMNLGTSKKTRGRPRKSPINSNSSKFKLQLFPIDKKTRIGLEMDRCHPYLQLTISLRKRISSVLRRLNSKYSVSRIARGDPILLPYNLSKDSKKIMWTLDDCETTAEEVHAIIGRPAVLRLRYGWINQEKFANNQEESLADFAATLEELINTPTNKEGQVHEENLQPSTDCNPDKNSPGENYGQGEEQKLMNWDDNLTNISVGDLLSEASLQGILACASKVNESLNEMQVSQLGADAFEAKFPPTFNSYIFDGEDTCNAFSFNQKSILSEEIHADFPSANNDENSLGLSGIKWADSMSGFEFFNRKAFDEESLSLGKIIS